jgi:hypothetical protein
MEAAAIFVLLFLMAIYFVLAIVAITRHHHNTLAIFVTNLLLGWTLLGWVAALIWACTAVNRTSPGPPR